MRFLRSGITSLINITAVNTLDLQSVSVPEPFIEKESKQKIEYLCPETIFNSNIVHRPNSFFMKGLFPLLFSSLFIFQIHAQSLDWVAQLGGTLPDAAYSVAIDEDDNLYTTGSFEGIVDLDPGPGSTVHLSAGDADVFVTKQSPDGQLIWSIHFGGSTEDYGEAIEVDQDGNVYVAGYFNGTADFNPGSGQASLTSAGDYDLFIAKFDANGQFIWARRIGDVSDDQAKDIALDTAGHVVMGGYFNGTIDADPGTGMEPLTSAGGNDILLVKLTPDADFEWAVAFGDTGDDAARALATDAENSILITGRFEERVDFDPGAGIANLTANGAEDAFVCKLTEDGDYAWAVHFGSDEADEGLAIHTDTSGNVYSTGFFTNEADFDPGLGVTTLTSAGEEDIYIAILNADGDYILARQFGGPGVDKAHGIATDTAGNIYTAGYFSDEADFDPDTTEAFYTAEGGLDAFVSKLSSTGTFRWLAQLGGSSADRGLDLVIGDSVRVFTIGYFEGTVDFDPQSSEQLLTSFGASDVFVVALEQCYPVQIELTETACDQYTSPDGEETWTSTGIYMDTTSTVAGCDTFYTVHLTILNSTSAEMTITACDAYTSPDGLEVWTSTGIYLDTLVNSVGCDSIITIDLTINNSSAFEFEATACDSFISPDGLETWTTSGTYIDTLVNTAGCDSIITVELTIYNSAATELLETACDSFVSPDGLEVWTLSGTYQDTLSTINGCDSVITVQLTIVNSSSVTLDVTACDSFISSDGEAWTTSGIYLDTIPNSSGCDSIITYQLTVLYSSASEFSAGACAFFTSPDGQEMWTESGIYMDTISNSVGCDSVITVNLTVYPVPSSELTVEACDSYTTPSGAFTWTTSGTYEENFPTGGQCDSVVIYHLTIYQSAMVDTAIVACESYPSPDGNEIWTESGIYTDTLQTVQGCDSIITIQLTIDHPVADSMEISACDQFLSPDGSTLWTESGWYSDTLHTQGGCDSVLTINLTIVHSTSSAMDVTACESYTSPDGQDIWTTSGIYMDTLMNSVGCDSVITIQLTILEAAETELTVDACDRYTLPGGSETYTSSGTYQEVFVASNGCDSTVTVHLTIFQSTSSAFDASACESFLSPSLKYQWTESGIYLDTIPNVAGCDSVMTIDLTIITIDKGVTQADHVLTADMPDATYQWIDCLNGNQPIAGETNQVFTATANGQYAVIISSGGCTDTSSCYMVTTVSTSVVSPQIMNLYPNPSNGRLMIELGGLTGEGLLLVMDSQGKTCHKQTYHGEPILEVNIDGPSGIYFVTMTGDTYRIVKKVIVEKRL